MRFILAAMLLGQLLVLAACVTQPAEPWAARWSEDVLLQGPTGWSTPEPEVEVLALDAEMREFLERHVAEGSRERNKTQKLMQSFFGGEGIDIQYDNIQTHTAIETFHRQSGNCLSFTNLFVAMAREVGLRASFQEVETPPIWNNQGELYIFNRHINVLVEYRRGPDQVVDFDIENFDENYPRKKISDRAAEAQYHNNMSVHWMLENDPGQALAHLRKAIELQPRASYMWANMGVLYSRFGFAEYAESAWLTALAKNHSEYVAISNLARLYTGRGEQDLAAHYRERAQRFRRNNPYYLYAQAEHYYQRGDYDQAMTELRRAIRLDDGEHLFHRLLGLVQLKLDQTSDAQDSFTRAAALNAEPRYAAMYSRKLKLMAAN